MRRPSPPRASSTVVGRRYRRVPRRVRGLGGVGRLLLVVTLLTAGGLYVGLEKHVTLVVDGESSRIRTFASSVGALLAAQGVEITEHDEVTPPPGAGLSDGMTVEVVVAKRVTLVLNGKPRTLFVTGQTVEDVLEHVNLRSSNRAYIRPSRGAVIEDGSRIVLREAVQVRVKVDGADQTIITNAPDVGYLLVSLGVILRKHDEVAPGLARRVRSGMEIQVTRVTFKKSTRREQVPFETEKRYSDDYVKGETIIRREGKPGVREKVYRLRMEDGKEASRKLLRDRIVEEPVSRIVVHGTREPPAPVERDTGGGNTNVQEGLASWYERPGMTAAHKTLPFGTRVQVTNLANGRSVSVTIDDRGPYISGRIIDLSDDAFEQLAPLGAGTINVRISW